MNRPHADVFVALTRGRRQVRAENRAPDNFRTWKGRTASGTVRELYARSIRPELHGRR
ncbi:hypothetical protein ACIODW_23270 [Streptomyces sp. NPDC087897]|uniref:hypothetical protein n=1 Tax=Streptomyces sp. NPDC087897 TaxID=3365817 RepID=UPI00382CE2B3